MADDTAAAEGDGDGEDLQTTLTEASAGRLLVAPGRTLASVDTGGERQPRETVTAFVVVAAVAFFLVGLIHQVDWVLTNQPPAPPGRATPAPVRGDALAVVLAGLLGLAAVAPLYHVAVVLVGGRAGWLKTLDALGASTLLLVPVRLVLALPLVSGVLAVPVSLYAAYVHVDLLAGLGAVSRLRATAAVLLAWTAVAGGTVGLLALTAPGFIEAVGEVFRVLSRRWLGLLRELV